MTHQIPQSFVLLPQSHVLLPIEMLLLTQLLTFLLKSEDLLLRLFAHWQMIDESLVLVLRNLNHLRGRVGKMHWLTWWLQSNPRGRGSLRNGHTSLNNDSTLWFWLDLNRRIPKLPIFCHCPERLIFRRRSFDLIGSFLNLSTIISR